MKRRGIVSGVPCAEPAKCRTPTGSRSAIIIIIRRPIALTLLLVLLVSPTLALRPVSGWKVLEEHWFVQEIDGAKAGWVLETRATDGKQFRSESRSEVSVLRMGSLMTIKMESSFTETIRGKPVEMRSRTVMATQPVERTWRFAPDEVVLTTTQGGRTTVATQTPPKDALTPVAADRAFRLAMKRGEESIEVRVIDPSNGLDPVTETSRRVGSETITVMGEPREVSVWEVISVTSGGEIAGAQKIDADGLVLHQSLIMPGIGEWVTRLATREQALESGRPAPEILLKTFLKPSKPLRNAGRIRTLKLHLRSIEGSLPRLPTAGAQLAEMSDDGRGAMLSIDIDKPQATPGPDRNDSDYVISSTMIGSDDRMVMALAAKAVRRIDQEDPWSRAEAMRAFVNRHVSTKDLDTGFASASETATRRTGDCSEHAVLLCAMLRAQEIPARVAIGLVYVDEFAGERGIFGWHMWTQALLDGRWVDFDATLSRRYHAGHILTATSALADTAPAAELASTLLLMGNLEVEVLDVGY